MTPKNKSLRTFLNSRRDAPGESEGLGADELREIRNALTDSFKVRIK